MAKKSYYGAVGGILMLLGSLIYLAAVFSWYGSGATASWLSAAQFLGPFVAAVAIISSISLFFMSIGTAAGKMDKKMVDVQWKFIMLGGMTVIIVTAAGSWFYAAIVGFLLTYIGAMAASM